MLVLWILIKIKILVKTVIISGVGTLGAGVNFKVAKHISLPNWFRLKYRVWQDVEVYITSEVNNSYYILKGTISTTEILILDFMLV